MVSDQHCLKLDPKAEMHIFVGVAEHAKAWKYFNKISRHVQMSRNITFDEKDTKLFPIPNEDDEDESSASLEGESHSGERMPGTTQGDPSTLQMSPNSSAIPPTQVPTPILEIRRSTQITNKPDYRLLNSGSIDRVLISHEIITEPDNYTEAIAWDDSPIWYEAMNTEIGKLREIRAWELVELSVGQTAIGCQWVYAVKTKPDRKFDTARAQVVTQGFTQRPGMDYFDIMAPVVKFDSLRTCHDLIILISD